MRLGRVVKGLLLGTKGLLLGLVVLLAVTPAAWATEFHGQVVFGSLPVPGAQATVTATQGDKTVTAITDDQGLFAFPDLTDGAWTITISLTGFAPIKEPITVAPNSPIPVFELKLQTLSQIRAEDKPVVVQPGTAPVVSGAAVDTAVANAGGTPATPANGKAAPAKGATQTAGNEAPPPPPPAPDSSPDGFLINGSVNNAATSQFSLSQAFGNARNSRSLYNTTFSLNVANSSLNANTYSLLGAAPKPNFTNFSAQLQFGGPLKIPHLLPAYRAPNFYISYGRSQSTNVNIPNDFVPPGANSNGDYDLTKITTLTSQPVYAPTSGLRPGCTATPGAAFVNEIIPASCISPVATALLKFYPTPNKSGIPQYNYQIPISTTSHSDFGSINLSKQINNKNNINGSYNLQSSRSSNPNLFGFVDKQDNLGQSMNVNWSHRMTQRVFANIRYQFSRQRNDTTIPFQAANVNVSGLAGISGNLQDRPNYGPPSLGFSTSGIPGLYDGTSRNNRNQTQQVTVNFSWNRFRHNMTMAGDFRRQAWNYFNQANPRGTISFTGAATQTTSGGTTSGGMDFADFLLGLPDTSQIAYGNADKYLRQSVYDAYFDDDFRVSPELTVHYGIRWDYGAPVTETKNRLVNLDFSPNFAGEAPVLGTSPTGSLSHQQYPTSLLRPDKSGFSPTVAIAWRPISGSSLLVKSGFGIYYDTSVYQQAAIAMAQQTPGLGAPWTATSSSISASSTCPLSLATPFSAPACGSATTAADTFGIDPNFRVGYVETWNLILSRDLPAAMQLTVTYNGTKGMRGVQEILPNTYPVPTTLPVTAADPCPSCPKGFFYRMSNGNLTRESGQVQLRRRLRAGFQASAAYTFAKSLDDYYSYGGNSQLPSSGSTQVAQDWRNPSGQRGLSQFDQRQNLSTQLQYTTGMGLGGRPLMSGWRGAIYKEWTVLTNIGLGSGSPETVVDPVTMPGTAFTNIIRADYNGQPVHQNTTTNPLVHLNQAAFSAPINHFGSAPRGFIIGPNQFNMSASMQRTFRLRDHISMDARIDATNVLNHVTFNGWNTTLSTINSSSSAATNSQFGTPNSFSQTRSVSLNLRVRY